MPSSSRLVGPTGTPPGVEAPMSSTCVTPAGPGDQLALPEDRHEGLHVGVVHVADHRVVVGEDVAGPDLRVVLVVRAHHVLDRVGHRVDVHDDPGGERDRVALRRVEREAQLAQLAHDRRGGDVERRLARRDQPAAQAAEQLLVADRVGVLQLAARPRGRSRSRVSANSRSDSASISSRRLPSQPIGARLARLELPCRVDDRHRLLHQPGGFEGSVLVGVGRGANDLAITKGPDVEEAVPDLGIAPLHPPADPGRR